MKTKINPRARHRFRRRAYRMASPVTEVLNLVNRRLEDAKYKALTTTAYRKSLRAIVDDDAFWKQLESLRRNVQQLKIAIDDLL
jgi:hypothetical protein